MSDIICVTNRSLCREDFLFRIDQVASAHPAGIILREKYLSEDDYRKLAKNVSEICKRHGTPCILHSFWEVAVELKCNAIHLPLHILRTVPDEKKKIFKEIGASCHSKEDAIEACQLGCTYITAGHIFETDCKRGLPGRGLKFLKNVCESVSVPVYAIGGISANNMAEVRKAGAKGACVMSGVMCCKDVREYLDSFNKFI
ncbi:MAG: thiamine phosphate synthase [Lachnospiraceae bacterium]